VAAVLLALATLLVAPHAAGASEKYAAIVIDAASGKVLHADQADELRYPASMTKMMTLYLVFERLQSNELSYETRLLIDGHAAAQPPSKLGLKPGSSISVRDAIGALATKSANDVAAAVATHIAGSEPAFARLMTQKARALGMMHTQFRNASGLPDRQHRTTARDMATLSLRLMRDFPVQSRVFRTRSFTYANHAYRNHNGLLFRFRGTDGIKTGYTRMSGFNLATSVRRDGRHLIAVVMGGRTARSRDDEVVRLVSRHLPQTTASASQEQPSALAESEPVITASAPERQRLVLYPRRAAAAE
jgi:D-alanyl-D-alanine carboxypeptidase